MIATMKGYLLPKYQGKWYDNFVGREESLILSDTGLILVDKLPISSSVVKAPMLSFQKHKDKVESKLGNKAEFETVGLVEFTKGKGLKMFLPSDSLKLKSYSGSGYVWTLNELFHNDEGHPHALEDFLSSHQGSDLKKLDSLESCDLINYSSSITDEFVEISQRQPWVQKKIAKEEKDEVDKFLKASQARGEWISDAEESSHSDDSLFEEDGKWSLPSIDRGMKEMDLTVNYEKDCYSSKIENVDIHSEKIMTCDYGALSTDKIVETASKGSYLTEIPDWQIHSHGIANDKDFYAKNSKCLLEVDTSHVNDLRNCSVEHIATLVDKSILEVVGDPYNAIRHDIVSDIKSGLYKDDVKVQKVGEALPSGRSVFHQQSETIDRVDGLVVLELCKASSLQNSYHRKESSDEFAVQHMDNLNESIPETSQNLLTLPSGLTLDIELGEEGFLMDKRLSMQGQMQCGTSISLTLPKVNADQQEHFMDSMDFSDGTLELLHVFEEDSRSTDLGLIPCSDPISQSASVPFSGSISLRSDSSNNSTHSFAFPVLATEWTSSPVKMAPPDHRYLRKKQRCYFSCFGCTKASTIL